MSLPDLLVLDADDTLWESARFFRRAEEDFLSLVHSLGHDPDAIRSEIHKRDVQRLSVTGYGARPYMDTLHSVLDELGCSGDDRVEQAFLDIERNLLEHPVLLHEGVLDTLTRISNLSMTCIVYTAGERGHQTSKFRRSGLSRYVNAFTIVPVKTADSLRNLLRECGVRPSKTILAGDSPRSDINPALETGVNAVHVRRPILWEAEHEEFIHPERVSTITRLSDLLQIIEEPEHFFVCTADRQS